MGYTIMTLRSRSGIRRSINPIRRLSAILRENRKLRTENQRLKAEIIALQDDLQRDRMTRLWNRLGLHRRWSEHKYVGVLLIDVDDFKNVNDTYGHHVGDVALVTIANCISDNAIGARTGGDEFVALVRHGDPMEVAEKIRAAVNQPVCINGHHMALSVSIGVCMVPDGAELSECINHADQGAYQAKRAGRNRVVLWREENETRTNRDRRSARKR